MKKKHFPKCDAIDTVMVGLQFQVTDDKYLPVALVMRTDKHNTTIINMTAKETKKLMKFLDKHRYELLHA